MIDKLDKTFICRVNEEQRFKSQMSHREKPRKINRLTGANKISVNSQCFFNTWSCGNSAEFKFKLTYALFLYNYV